MPPFSAAARVMLEAGVRGRATPASLLLQTEVEDPETTAPDTQVLGMANSG